MLQYGDFPTECTNYETAKTVIVPVAYDRTSTWIKGADKGPAALLEASFNMEFYDIETDSEVFRRGIATDDFVKIPDSPEQLTADIKSVVDEHLTKNKFPILIGGEHSISIGSIQSHCEKFEDITILQLDAHGDLREKYQGSEFNHACVMNQARKLAPIVQVGIRAIDTIEKQYIDKGRMFYAEDIYNDTDWIDDVVSLLTKNVYITIDLDIFDPSIMPSTGTPEPGGLLWYPVLKLLRKVAENSNITGFDIVELCPNPANKAPDFLAAKLLYKLLTYKFEL